MICDRVNRSGFRQLGNVLNELLSENLLLLRFIEEGHLRLKIEPVELLSVGALLSEFELAAPRRLLILQLTVSQAVLELLDGLLFLVCVFLFFLGGHEGGCGYGLMGSARSNCCFCCHTLINLNIVI